MNLSKIKRKQQIFLLIALILGMAFINLFTSLLNFQINDPTRESTNNTTRDLVDFDGNSIKSANYENTKTGSGGNLNLTLHESLVNSSKVTFSDIDTSSSFIQPCPIFSNFNSSFINVTIGDIYAPNKTLIIEDSATQGSYRFTNSEPGATSFEVKGNGYLQNISIYVRNTAAATTAVIGVKLYNSTWDNINKRSKPAGAFTGISIGGFSIVGNPAATWYSIYNVHYFLNNSKTQNNTWFIGLFDTGLGSNAIWFFVDDIDLGGGSDGVNETRSYYYSGGNWILRDDTNYGVPSVDFRLKVELSPKNNVPNPNDIGLKINNTLVTGYSTVNGSGYWSTTNKYWSSTGKLRFNLSADWWSVKCNITKVQINYTKTDLKASSVFRVLGSGQNILWNVTRSAGLNYFESIFNNYTINFTIPSTWSGIKIFNGSVDKTSSVSTKNLYNGYTDIKVSNAGNGTYWFLNATSSNLLQSIDTYVGMTALNVVNYTNVVHFDASFSKQIAQNNGLFNLSVYSPAAINNKLNYTSTNSTFSAGTVISLGNWDLSKNVTEYGAFRVQVFWNNLSAVGFMEKLMIIVADTSLSLVSPPNSGSFFNNVKFNLTILFRDIGKSQGISSAVVSSYNSVVGLGSLTPNGTNGYYYTEINTSYYSFGWNSIEINASKQYFNNKTFNFTFQKINQTMIDDITKNFAIIRGINITYTFNYTDINYENRPITAATITELYKHADFTSFWKEDGNGNYSIQLNTSKVTVGSYDYNFSISKIGEESQTIRLSIQITITQTKIESLKFSSIIAKNSRLNQSITFYMNDTTNDKPVLGLRTDNITVSNNETGLIWNRVDFNWKLIDSWNNGTYILNVSLKGLDSDTYILKLNASGKPNYDWTIAYITFYLRGNYSTINLIEFSDASGKLSLDDLSSFIGNDLEIEFNITDNEFLNSLVKDIGLNALYSIWYNRTSGTSLQGYLTESIQYDANFPFTYKGSLSSSSLDIGSYLINVSVVLTNYEIETVSFNLTIIDKYDTRITVIDQPSKVNAGGSFKITIKIEYKQGSSWKELKKATVNLIPYYNEEKSAETLTKETDGNGEIEFEITVPNNAKTLLIQIQVEEDYDYTDSSLEISDIKIVPLLEVLLPFLILVGIAAVVAIGSIAIYKGIIVPKKREKERVLAEVKTIFDDAINLEHLLVLYKATGTCIFFKSFGTEGIDPELISGFLTAVSSFGKEMESQQALNEITYGDKMLLLADGEYVRVALVLSKKASIILSKRLKEFIESFEKAYTRELPDWRGQLDIFKNSGHIADEILNTSIILPHEITYSSSDVKSLKNPIARDVLKIANSLIEGSERKFFFIATLLTEATEKTGKESAEVFMGIKELRDKHILKAIEISNIEKQPITQQELNLISQKVSELPGLNPEERQRLLSELSEMGLTEREAYLASLSEKHEIVSAPVKAGTSVIENAKTAKKEISKLIKNAKGAVKDKDHQKAIDIYRNAAMLATNWDLTKEFQALEETIRLTTIDGLQEKMKKLENDAKLLVKDEKYAEAAQIYKQSSEAASEIFKLGVTEMTKEVKRLSNKAKEFEKLK